MITSLLAKNRSSSTPVAVVLFVVLISGFGSWYQWYSAVDRVWYDFLVRHHKLDYPDDVVIVAIDEASIERIGAWPWDRRYHARLLDRLSSAEAVVFDLIFAEEQSPFAQADKSAKTFIDADKVFAARMREHGGVLLPMYVGQQQFQGMFQELLPIKVFAKAASAMGHAHVEYDADGIARGIQLRIGLGSPFWPHLSLALAETLGELPTESEYLLRQDKESDSPYKIHGEHYKYLRFAGAEKTLFHIPYIDVLDGLVPVEQFTGMRVFVGATATGLGDDIPTPVGAISGVELHANAYQAVRTQAFVNRASPQTLLAISCLTIFFVCAVLSRLAPSQFLFGTLLATAIWLLVIALTFFLLSLWIPPTSFLVALLIFYPLWSWRRIQIALHFLRRELDELKQTTTRHQFDIEQLNTQIEQLIGIGVLKAGEISRQESGFALAIWPDVDVSASKVSSIFQARTNRYRIQLEGNASADQALRVLHCIMAYMPVSEKPALGSYELVERTINEIYAARNIADRAQNRMNQSMERLQDAVLVSDVAGRIIFGNEAAKKIFSSNVASKSIFALEKYLGSFQWPVLLTDLMVNEKQIYQELDTPDEQRFLCQASMLKDDVPSLNTLLFVFTDVTELRLLEKSKNEALAFLSHDMRSPLVSQLALIEKFRIKFPDAFRQQDELVEKLVFFAEKSLKYSEDFLQISRAEHLDDQSFQLVDMHSVVDGAYSQMAAAAMSRDISIQIIRTYEDCWVMGDAQLLERAIANLLSNAIQHSPVGGEIELSLQAENEIQVAVTDNGRGIEQEMLPHLFEPYFRARRKTGAGVAANTDRTESGVQNYGLGLSFVYSVLKRHDGHIEVESSVGVGTIFTLRLAKTDID